MKNCRYLLLVLTTYASAATQGIEAPLQQGLELPSGKYAPGYNASANIEVDRWILDVWASFTYWNVDQEVNDVALNFSFYSDGAPPVTRKDIQVPSHWTPGFKVGVACNCNYDDWVIESEYTWVRSSASVSATNTSGSVNGQFTNSTLFPYYTSGVTAASSKWSMGLDQVDLVLSRPWYEGTRITSAPYFGLRGLWIRQRQTGDLLNGSGHTLATGKSHMWSVGSVAGMSGRWLLGKGFRFEGDFGGSIVYARYSHVSSNFTPAGYFSVLTQRRQLSRLRPMADCSVGLGWGSYLGDRDYFLDLKADYEFHYYWAQNLYRQISSYVSDVGGGDIGALMIQGLTLTCSLDF